MKHFQSAFITFTIILLLATTQKVSAATFTVTNTNDSDAGSLRQAILDANVNNQDDTIQFDPSVFSMPQTITLTSGQLTIEPDNASGVIKSLTIFGTGADMLTISGNNQSRVILMTYLARAVITKIKITGGNAPTGGGIADEGGFVGDGYKNLILTESIITGNSATYGGGIASYGYETLIFNTTITNNSALNNGGGGGIYLPFSAHLRIINSTISGNTAGAGGGIYNSSGNLFTVNCTVAYNSATNIGGGIFLTTQGINFSVYFSSINTIIAKNTVANGDSPDVFGHFNFAQNNIVGNSAGADIPANSTGNQVDIDPQLDPVLKINGGVLPTHALSAGSPAIDNGSDCVLNPPPGGCALDAPETTDERGVARPQDGSGDGTATVDIGAFEILRSEVLSAPNSPDLRANNDTGISNSDNITTSRNLTFDVNGVTNGTTIEFFRNGVKISETIASGSTVTFSDNNLPADGTFLYSVRQIVNNVPSLFSAAVTVTIDNTAPTVTINQAAGQADPTQNQPINFTLAFSENVVGFDASDVSLANSTAGVSSANVVLTGSGRTYNVLVSNITSDGIVRATLAANAVQDLAGNASAASTSTDNSVTLDTTPPTVTINQAANQADPTRNSTVNFTVVFSEVVNTFSSAGVTLAGSTANVSSASIVVTGSGTTYNVAVNNISSNGGFVQATVFPSAALDLVGLPNVAYSTSTDNQVTVDNISPTVTINQAVGQSDPTGTLPVNFTVVFSEPVTGFDASDISLSGSTINTSGASIVVTGSGTIYNVAVGNVAANNGFLRATVRPSAATDLIGNFSFASTSTDNTVTVDTIAPTVSINQAIGQSDPTSVQPVNFTVVFSELVTGFTAADISLGGSTANVSSATVTITGSGNVYNVAIGNIISGGQVRASIISGAAQDAVGNLSAASTSTDNIITVNAKSYFDFDGDGKADVSVFRSTTGTWYLNQSNNGFGAVAFGISSDKTVPADYDGDGKTDVAVFRQGIWYLQRSQAGFTGIAFGAADDIPVPADYDGDGKADVAVFRPSNGTWYVYNLLTNQTTTTAFGQSGDKPVAADYDGDGKADIAVNRIGTWYIQRSQLGFTAIQFGDAADKLVPADYDGDGRADVAVFRPSNGTWYIQGSTAGFTATAFGLGTDMPVPADYDGDGKTDVAVFRDGTWYLNRSTQGFTGVAFGASNDTPIPNVYVR